jgi:hypothetical protein
MKIGDKYPYKPRPAPLIQGMHCKGCDAPLGQRDDPELCRTCMNVVLDLNNGINREIEALIAFEFISLEEVDKNFAIVEEEDV